MQLVFTEVNSCGYVLRYKLTSCFKCRSDRVLKESPSFLPHGQQSTVGQGWGGIFTEPLTQALSTLSLRHTQHRASSPRSKAAAAATAPASQPAGRGKANQGARPVPQTHGPVSCRQHFCRHPPGCCRVTRPCRAARAPRKCNHRWWPSSSCYLRFCPQRKGRGYWGTEHDTPFVVDVVLFDAITTATGRNTPAW